MNRRERPVVFFGYPFRPRMRGEAIVSAAEELDKQEAVDARLWEKLSIAGRFVIDAILAAIDEADLAAFDVTELNHNVMFELGYAMGTDHKVWLLRDDSDAAAKRAWGRVKILTTVGYSPFTNSDHIVDSFWRDRPDQAETTIFQSAVEGYLQPATGPALFYLPSLHETEAGRQLTRRVKREEQRGLRCIVADPDESAVRSLSWYAQHIYSSNTIVAHFCSPARTGAEVHNARCALISGLARGMGKRLLMLAEDDYATPIDYRDLLFVYETARHAVAHADTWLEENLAESYRELAKRRPTGGPAAALAVELRSLRIGDHIAENEEEDLSDYFIETASFHEVMAAKTTVFVGRKGTGKTANLLRAAQRLANDKRNLVCVIKPASYELEAVVSLMRKYREKAEQGYLVESLWKFLIYSEIANVAYQQLKGRPAQPASGSAEDEFIQYMEGPGEFLQTDFAVRLETAVDVLLRLPESESVAEHQTKVSEALHRGILLNLREHIGRVLSGKERVAVLVDNLDKAWHKHTDIELMANFLLGLLSSVGRIADEFARSDYWREPVRVTLAVFLRSDIYGHVVKIAREPDKIPVSRLLWTDKSMLLRVIEERYAASHGAGANEKEIWTRFFCPKVRGVATPDYIINRVLPAPRDIIHFCSEAIASAVNRRSTIVEAEDILRAEALYSQFAFEAVLVGNGISMEDLESVLYEFAGSSSVMNRDELIARVARSGVSEDRTDDALEHLYSVSFLGVETGDNQFDFAFEEKTRRLVDALARSRGETKGTSRRYQIHPAFQAYLEISGN